MLAKSLGVLGDPVHHSKSPAMHGAALAVLGLPHHYCAYHVRAPALGAALAGAKALGFLGLNLTIPHKVAALSHLDEIALGARRIGAVNTVHFHEGRAIGHNTDAPGFVRGWGELGLQAPAKVMLLGSGGAARAVLDGIGEAWPDAQIHWVSRRPSQVERPEHLQDRIVPRAYDEIPGQAWSLDCELWVNATSVGLADGPAQFPCALPTSELSSAHGVVDIVYTQGGTQLLREAKASGAAVQDGRTMLLWQGVLALEIWLEQGISPEAIAAMRSCLDLPVDPAITVG